jgi:hypothetical protein
MASPVGEDHSGGIADPFVRHSSTRPSAVLLWVRSGLLGIVLGTIFLGIGGRAAMRAIAIAQNGPTGFSFGGSLTVVFLGAASGLAAGLIYAACRRFLSRSVWLARAVFAVIFLAITLRGLRPLDAQRLILFLPLFAAFGLAFDRLWDRVIVRGQSEPRLAA